MSFYCYVYYDRTSYSVYSALVFIVCDYFVVCFYFLIIIATVYHGVCRMAACSVLYVTSLDTESLTGPEAVTKATEYTLRLDPAPKTTVVHFKVSSQGITLTDLRHR